MPIGEYIDYIKILNEYNESVNNEIKNTENSLDEKMQDIKIQTYAYPDEYIRHGTVEELEKIYHVDDKSIEIEIKKKLLNNICK